MLGGGQESQKNFRSHKRPVDFMLCYITAPFTGQHKLNQEPARRPQPSLATSKTSKTPFQNLLNHF